jgi:DNA-binding Lrp family transcriptional regulator
MATTTKTTPSWRDVLNIHPAAELFPRMSPDELRALGEDIKKNGLTSSIAITSDKQLLDGRNRLDAMEMVGIEFKFARAARGLFRIDVGTDGLYWPNIVDSDPYAYVISANIHRRHLNVYQRDELITKLLKADPKKSNRQIAKMVKASHPHVAKVRQQAEKTGDVETVTTSIDTKGRQQPATKPVRARSPTHVCWQCGQRGKVGEVQEHRYASYDDADVWLHDACVSAFEQAERQREQEREASAERIRALMGGEPEPRDDIVPASNGEVERLRARNEELEAENACLRRENIGLKSEVEELKARLATLPPADDGLDIPASLRRAAP